MLEKKYRKYKDPFYTNQNNMWSFKHTVEQKKENTNHPSYPPSEKTNVCNLVTLVPAAIHPPIYMHRSELFF